MKSTSSTLTTNVPEHSLAHLGEVELIRRISDWLGPVSPPSPEGMGDDCAVIRQTGQGQQILTTDAVSYGQHFDDQVSPEDAGAKLIKRNLSDIAAMGGIPGPAVLALLCGPDISLEWLESFFRGIRRVCEQYAVPLVGGDISSLRPGNFSAVLSLTGRTETPRLRHTARNGDSIYVTGQLGGSILGKHYKFEPRLEAGRWIAGRPESTAMMDLTDGLAKDLRALIPPDCAAALHPSRFPLSDDARTLAQTTGLDPEEHAFCDGEDYELLFCLDGKTDTTSFEADWKATFPQLKITRIGSFVCGSPERPFVDAASNEDLPWSRGFEHLR
ncbi:thiamine-phosphate kinase [Coraliomargarita parva]|uniref:thiamine-phosphate kinase n=1 Tax=Coraliomargarita parva TaxID=3014050 RepID=UPI0022B2C5E3|nr:thiamine-phosphate kinase [Coraliomargarita parva]